MHWILQTNIFNEAAYEVLLETLKRLDFSHSVHKVVPFVGELVPEPELDTTNVICLGSYSMRHSAKKNNWYPGVFDLEPFDYTIQHAHWGEHMLQHDCIVKPFGEIMRSDFSEPEMFLRPVHDSKVFAGSIFHVDDFIEWKTKVCVLEHDYGTSLSADTLIQVCPVQKIFSEHRFWVVKGNIVTSSTYKLGSTVIYQSLPKENIYEQFARDRISEWQPHDSFVIDIADTEKGLKVVEINTLNSCGFYAADIQKLLIALETEYSQ